MGVREEASDLLVKQVSSLPVTEEELKQLKSNVLRVSFLPTLIFFQHLLSFEEPLLKNSWLGMVVHS